jgi:hypothetical protein
MLLLSILSIYIIPLSGSFHASLLKYQTSAFAKPGCILFHKVLNSRNHDRALNITCLAAALLAMKFFPL